MKFEGFAGVFAWIVTPFDEGGAVDRAALRRNLQGYGGASLGGYVVGGAVGEFAALGPEERQAVIATAIEEAAGRPVLVQGEPDLEALASQGVAGAIVPWPGPDRAAPLPVIARVPPDRSPEQLRPSLSGAGIAAVLDDTGDPDRLSALAGIGPAVCSSRADLLGAVSGVAAFLLPEAGALPFELCALWSGAGSARDLRPLLALVREGGVAAVKRTMDLLGYRGGGVRMPLDPLDPDRAEAITDALREAGLIRF